MRICAIFELAGAFKHYPTGAGTISLFARGNKGFPDPAETAKLSSEHLSEIVLLGRHILAFKSALHSSDCSELDALVSQATEVLAKRTLEKRL